jgi:two-component system, probable response regulator PhcQ
MNRIMLVDDEENILRALRRVLGNEDCEIETFTQPAEALRRAQVANFDLFISDYRMPGMDGVQLLTAIKELQPDAMRLILSGYADLEGVLVAINQAEIYRFICKPWQDDELRLAIHQALEHRRVLMENRHLAQLLREQQQELAKHKSALEQLAASHPALANVSWAPDGSIILDEGET